MLDSASEVLLKVASLGFGLTSSFAVSFEGCVFLFVLSQQLLQYPAKNILIAAVCFAAVAIGADWMGSVG
jgi:hypothetical protein